MSSRIEQLFAQTKLVCFGRYTLRVPLETQLTWGSNRINDGYETLPGQGGQIHELLSKQFGKVKFDDSKAEVIQIIKGPVSGAEYFWYYEDKYDKRDDTRRYFGAIPIKGHAFTYKGMALKGEADAEFALQLPLIKSLRYREESEIPKEPGMCIELGFVGDSTCKYHEESSAGLYLPSLPDVTFSVSSNSGAKDDKAKYSLLKRIASQKKELGLFYPKLTTLREGNKTVGIWDGEESLTKRPDGTHEFDWEFIGEERSVSHPGSLEVGLRSKVDQNRVGAADKASITDDEAIQLWDLLLGSLAFRVPVPGASRAEMSVKGMDLHPGDLCPVTGMWRAEHPSFTTPQEHYVRKGDTLLSKTWFSFVGGASAVPADQITMRLIKPIQEPGDKA